MSYIRKFKKELKQIEIPDKASVLGTAYSNENSNKKKEKRARKLALTPLVAVILCIVMVGGVAAAIPAIVRYVNAKVLTDNQGRLDTVPEGYIGIYTANDLDSIRSAPDNNYILMSDIDLSGISFTPIGSDKDDEIFSGIFNGNGYAVKGVTLDTSSVSNGYFGLFGKTHGYFINLCLDGLVLDIALDDPQADVCIGTIAGSANFLGGCYVKDCKINVTYNGDPEKELYVGGIAGTADHIDSCAVFADISVNGTGGNVYAALGTPSTFSAITTYTVGKIEISETFDSVVTDDVALTATEASMPVMLSETAMQGIMKELEEYYGSDRYYIYKFKSFFVPVDISSGIYDKLLKTNELFGHFYSENEEETIYIFDQIAKIDDVKAVHRELIKIFGSHEELLIFCDENGIKCGMINCFSFEDPDTFGAEDLKGFDFQNIWGEDDRIIPKIFID